MAWIYAQFYPALESGRLETLVTACDLQTALDDAAARFLPSG